MKRAIVVLFVVVPVLIGIVATVAHPTAQPVQQQAAAGTIHSRYTDCMAKPYPKNLSKAARKKAELERYEACNAEGNAAMVVGLKAVQQQQAMEKSITSHE